MFIPRCRHLSLNRLTIKLPGSGRQAACSSSLHHPYITGDGIGPEIMAVTQQVIDCAIEKAYGDDREIMWKEGLAGKRAYDITKSWLPQGTINTIKQYRLALKGPLTTPIGEGHESLNVRLRRELDLYACVRPIKYYEGVPTQMNNVSGLIW